MKTEFFAAIDNNNTVWGIGQSETDAIADARDWLSRNSADDADLEIICCDVDAAEKIKSDGWTEPELFEIIPDSPNSRKLVLAE